ncbi:MAG TPA: AAA family ATPase [Kofleriaceae bacterium]|nr:AAA family ATPase [Kofleriaceae bacterium]
MTVTTAPAPAPPSPVSSPATADSIDRAAAASADDLAREASTLRERINRFRLALGRFFVAKQPLIDLMCVAAVAQEPLLLVGPPGTAKSDLVIKFKDALRIPDGEYFEYLLTRFTEPSEVFGPIDIAELREGRYLRRDRGKLPTARLVFLDEIFKANSAILNSLLTVINERKFYQDGQPVPVKLRVLLAATNELPENAELAALKDRFCLKAACRSVQDEHFLELIDAGLDAYTHRELNQKPWIEDHASLEDFVKAHRWLTHVLARRTIGSDGRELRDRELYFSDELLRELRRVLKTLVREDGVFVSDRKVVKLYRLLRTHAWIVHGGAVERADLRLLSYLGETREEIDLLEEKVPRLLGLS